MIKNSLKKVFIKKKYVILGLIFYLSISLLIKAFKYDDIKLKY